MTDDSPRRPDDAPAAAGEVPPPPGGADISPAWAKNNKARLEEKYWTDEDRIRGVKLKNDILWHRTYGLIVVCLMVVFVGVFSVSLIVWVFHYVTSWGWLTPEQLSKIQSVIFSGSLGAIVSAYMHRRLSQ